VTLELDRATYRVKRIALVRDVSVRVEPGLVTAIVGPNGAGKSTVVRLLSGELRPAGGEARLDGKDLRRFSHRALAERRAVVAQRSELAFDFAVLDVVLLGRHPFNGGYPSNADRWLALSALERVGLGAFVERGYTSLSGGERQRVQIARSLVQLAGRNDERPVPRTWLLDEPTSALDLRHQHRLMALCREHAAAGSGVCVVLHDLNLALRYADRVVLMRAGEVFAAGEVESVLTSKNLQAVYEVDADVVPLPPTYVPQLVVR